MVPDVVRLRLGDVLGVVVPGGPQVAVAVEEVAGVEEPVVAEPVELVELEVDLLVRVLGGGG